MDGYDPVFVLSTRYALALLFVSAGVVKLRHMAYFRATLKEYAIVPATLVATVAPALAALEIAIAIGLIAKQFAAIAALIGLVTLLIYTGAIAFNLLRGRRDIDCGCSGPAARQALSGWLVVRNGALILVALVACAQTSGRNLMLLDFVTVGLTLASGTVLYAVVNQLCVNLPSLDALDNFMEQT